MAVRERMIRKGIAKCGRDLVDLILAPGSRPRGIYELGLKGRHVMAKEGLAGLQQKSRRYLYRKLFQRRNPFKPASEKELEKMRMQCSTLGYRPKISIVTPVRNTRERWLRSAIDSVLSQIYDNWELCIADDASDEPHIKEILDEYQRMDPRIKVVYLDRNRGVSGASNEALALATGEYIGFLDHDDILLPDALYEVILLLNRDCNADFIYSDEIIISEAGKPVHAYFRPDFSLDYMLSHCYIVHFVVLRASIVNEIGGFREEFKVSQDYDLFLRMISQTRRILHIPKILYKWRLHDSSAGHLLKQRVMESSQRALQDLAKRERICGTVSCTEHFNFFRLKRGIADRPMVSIIIPTKDRIDLLDRCIESIRAMTSYDNYEIIAVDNLSQEEETATYLNRLQENCPNCRVLRFDEKFNYSKLNNYAARHAHGSHLLFLNNDVEVLNSEWLEAMLEQSQREEIGCVGAKLLYPDRKIQHVGVVIGWGGVAEHIYKWSNSDETGYMGHFVSIRNYSAVTAACMMVEKDIFESIGGFDESFEVGFGDIDFCLRVREKGYENIYTPYAELIHYESSTRGKSFASDPHPDDTEKFVTRWKNYIERGDPYYNPNLPLDSHDIASYVSGR